MSSYVWLRHVSAGWTGKTRFGHMRSV